MGRRMYPRSISDRTFLHFSKFHSRRPPTTYSASQFQLTEKRRQQRCFLPHSSSSASSHLSLPPSLLRHKFPTATLIHTLTHTLTAMSPNPCRNPTQMVTRTPEPLPQAPAQPPWPPTTGSEPLLLLPHPRNPRQQQQQQQRHPTVATAIRAAPPTTKRTLNQRSTPAARSTRLTQTPRANMASSV